MTISAHGARRVWGGASLARNVEPGTTPRASMFYELNPHLRPKLSAEQRIAERIRPWLAEHGPATAQEIAIGLGCPDARSVNRQFANNRVDNVVVVGTRQTSRNRRSKVWGLRSKGRV